ncbi:MAG: class I SAM-dependent rRNA methyltransferase [Granulosicoccus sp.]|nr:class I SAM-dependent rRNA methyltransferase [Granulosicoccus sp.]
MTALRLRKREERRVRAGHCWVFSNEIDILQTPLKGLEPGSAVTLESVNGKFLAHAYVNPHSLICARVTSREAREPFNATVLRTRLRTALDLREHRYAEPFYRLVYSEGDFLPGLIVDRYAGVLVVQITTAGMERYRDDIVDALQSLTGASAVYLRNDSPMRDLEQLPGYRQWALGDPVDVLSIRENKLQFQVPAELGQKTGWFYDHRESRAALSAWVRGRRVLDVYTYLGGFALNAAAAGARQVVGIDASRSATDAARDNARLNGVQDRVEFHCDDAVEAMRSLFAAGERFDVVVLDPPAFIKRRKDREAGLRHYALNNRLAMRLLTPGGILFSASCSQTLSHEDLLKLMQQNTPRGVQGMQVLAPLQQGPDHPVNGAMPETLYLTGTIARLI